MQKKLNLLQAFEFSAAHYLRQDGSETSPYGHTFSGWAGVAEPMSHAELQTNIDAVLQRYTHQTLPESPGPEPTITTVAQTLWDDWRATLPVTLIELTDDDGLTARITHNQSTLVHPGQFSAAHRTYAPRLTEAENRALYGKCANLHGHNYRAEVVLPPHAQWPTRLWDEFDHVNLSSDIPDLRGRNVVTEAIAELIARRAPEAEWVRVWELPDFFAEYHRADASYRLGRRYSFRAPHRWAKVEVTVRGELDSRTETAYELGQLDAHCLAAIQKLNYPTGDSAEAIRDLWIRLAERLGASLTALRWWPTPRQQFSIGE